MNFNTERSNVRSHSSNSVYSLLSSPFPRREEILNAQAQARPQPSRQYSSNSYRLSYALSPQQPYSVNGAVTYPTGDPSGFSNRNSISQQIGPDVFRRSYSDNLSSMLPSQPSSHTFGSSHHKRATMQFHTNLVNGQQPANTNRASRYSNLPKRPSAEPANLINSIRDPPLRSNSKLTQLDSKRVVTGILHSALPPSARPPPLDTTSSRSMPIKELEKRHKAALQKLQSHTNQRAGQNSVPSQPNPTQPQQRPTSQIKTESLSDASLKPEKADKTGQTKKSTSTSYRRSFFSFMNSKEDSKSSKTAEELVESNKSSPVKKHKQTSKSSCDSGEAEDEDVPLAQLRDRRASQIVINHQTGNSDVTGQTLSRSFSVPLDMNDLLEKETLDLGCIATEDVQTHGKDLHHSKPSNRRNSSLGNHIRRVSSNLKLARGNDTSDRKSALTTSDNFPPDLKHSNAWLQANFDLDHEEKDGPRPLIFEDENKAIRNSKRLWV